MRLRWYYVTSREFSAAQCFGFCRATGPQDARRKALRSEEQPWSDAPRPLIVARCNAHDARRGYVI